MKNSDPAPVADRERAERFTKLAAVFSKYRDRLQRIVEARMDPRLRRRLDSSDVLQQAYIEAQQRLRHQEKRPVPVFVWLREITLQTLVDLHRHHLGVKKRTVRREVHYTELASPADTSHALAERIIADLTSPSQHAIREELYAELRAALDGMEDIDREILLLRHAEGLSNKEIAEALGIGQAAASNRYVRALTRLKHVLAKVAAS